MTPNSISRFLTLMTLGAFAATGLAPSTATVLGADKLDETIAMPTGDKPQPPAAPAKTNISFRMLAIGSEPLTYRWPGVGFTPLINTTKAQPTGTADDPVLATNRRHGVVTSVVVTVTVVMRPAITEQPTNQTGVEGSAVSFRITATGTLPLAYQWYFDDRPVADATNYVLSLTNVQAADFGGYWVVVTNPVGSVTSVVAMLQLGDSDADSLPDGWEKLFFGDLSQGDGGDPDGDGWTNLQEYENSTDPSKGDQPLKVIINRPKRDGLMP